MRQRLPLVLAFFALVVPALAADKEVEELLAKMRKVYSAAKSARITTVTTLPTQIGEMELITETLYLRPDKISSRIGGIPEAGEAGVTVKTDGKKLIITGPGGKQEKKFSMENVVQALPVNLETINFWDWKRQLSTGQGGNMRTSKFKILKKETWKNVDWMVLEETAPEQKVFVRYFVDPKTFLIHRTRASGLDNKELIMDAQITKLEIDAKVDASAFKL